MPKKNEPSSTPPGFKLLKNLRYKYSNVNRVAWSPDGALLAASMENKRVAVWDVKSGLVVRSLTGHLGPAHGISWSPDGKRLASASENSLVIIWDVAREAVLLKCRGDSGGGFNDVSWSPDGRRVAMSGIGDSQMCDARTGEILWTFTSAWYESDRHVAWSPDGTKIAFTEDSEFGMQDAGLTKAPWMVSANLRVKSVAWSPDSRMLAVAAGKVVQIWDTALWQMRTTLEGHTWHINSLSFSHHGMFLASKSVDGTVRLWRCDTWEMLAVLRETVSTTASTGIDFHPNKNILATLGGNGKDIRIWELDEDALLGTGTRDESGQYTNAKVVLVGDSGVGKSGLGLVLSGQEFAPTDSTHGRHVWVFDKQRVTLGGGRAESRETLLWDLAGQPGYRVFHRQQLNDVAVALVLFDSRSETDPFAGVSYWARSLDEATRGFPLVKFLVAARADRGGPPVSNERIEEVCRLYGFDGYFETSARSGAGVRELADAVRAAVAWDELPRVITDEVFHEMKSLVMGEKEAGRIIQRKGELLERLPPEKRADGARDSAVFETCLALVEATGLVKSLAFGALTLLQPEMLDDYGAWMAQAARREPDGLGFISDKRARDGDFPMDEKRSLRGTPEERLLIAATVEDIVARGIALRQPTERGEMLIFPSEMRTDIPDYPGDYVRAVTFTFEGPVKAIYATLAVCLTHAPAFSKERFFRNAALFRSPGDEACGFAVDYPDSFNDARGRLTVFFGAEVGRPTKLIFMRYINRQLEALAFEGSVTRERVYFCNCGYPEPTPQAAVEWRRKGGHTTVICSACGRHILIDDYAEQSAQADPDVDRQMALSDEERERQTRLAVLGERESRREFHVFVCHNNGDKPEVRLLVRKLRDQGLLPWLDEENLLAGDQFIPELEAIIESVPVAAVVFGPHSLGRWQEQEYYGLLQRSFEKRAGAGVTRLRLIPVLLPGAHAEPDLPIFLRGRSWIDFRGGLDNAEEMRRLVRSILDAGAER